MALQLVFNPSLEVNYGHFVCPECGAKFYYTPLHTAECTKGNFEGCCQVIGPLVVREVVAWAAVNGNDSDEIFNGLSLNDIRSQFSSLLPQAGFRPGSATETQFTSACLKLQDELSAMLKTIHGPFICNQEAFYLAVAVRADDIRALHLLSHQFCPAAN